MMPNEEDQFQFWLMDMEDAIERFRQSVPDSVSIHLDFSPSSLDILEKFILDKYRDVDEIKKQSEAQVADGGARYVGQVFRRNFGGTWTIDYLDRNNAFYGLPQIVGMVGQVTQSCPLTLVTASVDRRTGTFIKTVFNNHQTRAAVKIR
jgi:hypothetical protein